MTVVRLYWTCWPRQLRRRCIYRETCSRYVYRITRESGLLKGLAALKARFLTCRPGYSVTANKGEIGLVMCDGAFLSRDLAAEDILIRVDRAFTCLSSPQDRTAGRRQGPFAARLLGS
jgi:uncharacterized protein